MNEDSDMRARRHDPTSPRANLDEDYPDRVERLVDIGAGRRPPMGTLRSLR